MSDETLFAAARAIKSPNERAAYLKGACRDDPELRLRIETLLAADEQDDSLLDDPLIAEPTAEFATSLEKPGDNIGPYKLLQRIGEGGFGIVYLADQLQPVQRRVALKVIKPGMDSRQVIARFEAERQALAMMDHPNIAKVLDAGMTNTGRPYFVMELVKGQPITQFCDQQKMGPRERLQLFVPVCKAIQHAHQKGVIHRDIKPSNILVSLHDGRPVPQVIDFGVAKAIQHRLTEKTVFTQFGQVIGTLEYMSPEQAEMNQLDIDTRADVYSLGAVLYELLSGTTPFDRARLRSAAFNEMLRIIREEEPIRPSVRLSNVEALASISAQRSTEPDKLAKLIHGELDWIVMKALDKQRARRYDTASNFGADIERYLANEPVEAGPPTTRYRLSKLATKYAKSLVIAASFLSVLVVSIIVTTVLASWAIRQAQDARDAKAIALREKDRAEIAADLARKNQRAEAAGRLSAISGLMKAQYPQLAILLGIEAVNVTKIDGTVKSVARDALFQAIRITGGHPISPGATKLVRCSPDGKWLVTAGEDGAFLRNLLATDPIHSSKRLRGSATDAAEISPTGKWLATVANTGDVSVWDLSATRPEETGRSLSDPAVNASFNLGFSPDGRWLFTLGEDSKGRLWDLSRISADEFEAYVVPGGLQDADSGDTGHWMVNFSPDAKWLCANQYGRGDATQLWKLTAGPVGPVRVGAIDYSLGNPSFSLDGRWMVAGREGQGQVFDLSNDDPLVSPRLLSGTEIVASNFSKDGRWLFVVLPGELRLWDLEKESVDSIKLDSSLLLYEGATRGLCLFSDDSRWLIASDNTTIRIWDLAARVPELRLLPPDEQGILNVVISPDSRWLVTVPWSGSVFRLWSLQSKDSASRATLLRGHDSIKETMRSCAFGGDSRWLITSVEGGKARLWDLSRDDNVASQIVFPELFSIAGEGRWILTGSERTISRIDLAGPHAGREIIIPTAARSDYAAVTPSGRWLVTQDLSFNTPPDQLIVRMWDLEADDVPKSASTVNSKGLRFTSFRGASGDLSPNGSWIAKPEWESGESSWKVSILGLRGRHSGTRFDLQTTLPKEKDCRIGFGPDGRWLTAVSLAGGLNIWDFSATEITNSRREFAHPHPVTTIHYSRDKHWLFTCSDDGTMRCWNLSGNQPIKTVDTLTEAREVGDILAVSSNGEWIVSRSRHEGDPAIDVWQLRAGAIGNAPMATRHCRARRAAISRNGRWLATGHTEVVQIWDLQPRDAAKPSIQFSGHTGEIHKLEFSDDEQQLIVQDIGGVGYLCDLSVERLIARGEELAGRALTLDEQKVYVSSE